MLICSQEKILALREQKRALLDQRHHYAIEVVSRCVGLDSSAAVDYLLEGNQIERMNNFFAAKGHKALMFFYQEEVSQEIG